jgi:hypothetical protein
MTPTGSELKMNVMAPQTLRQAALPQLASRIVSVAGVSLHVLTSVL